MRHKTGFDSDPAIVTISSMFEEEEGSERGPQVAQSKNFRCSTAE